MGNENESHLFGEVVGDVLNVQKSLLDDSFDFIGDGIKWCEGTNNSIFIQFNEGVSGYTPFSTWDNLVTMLKGYKRDGVITKYSISRKDLTLVIFFNADYIVDIIE